MAITFWRSNYDEFDATKNGGDITSTQIESGVANSMLLPVRPRTAEVGGQRWFKFFIKTDIGILTIGIDVAKYTDSPTEEIYFGLEIKADHSDVEADLDKSNFRIYGGFSVVSVDATNKQITVDRDVREFVKAGDWVTFYDSAQNRVTGMFVDSVSSDGKTITFKLWTDKEITAGMTGSSTIYLTTLNANDYVGIWIREDIAPYTEPMEDPLNSFVCNVWYDEK